MWLSVVSSNEGIARRCCKYGLTTDLLAATMRHMKPRGSSYIAATGHMAHTHVMHVVASDAALSKARMLTPGIRALCPMSLL